MLLPRRHPLGVLALASLVACFLTACQEAQPLAGTLAASIAAVRLSGRHGMARGGYGAGKNTAFGLLRGALAKNQPLTCGHRGAKGYAPENTLPAFALAQAEGCHMVECDVRLSLDQQLVVLHDDELSKTTNGHGHCRDHAYAGDLDALDAGSWFSPAYAHTRIPTLRETLLWSKDRPLLPLIHLKEPGLAAPLAGLLSELGLAEKVAVHSELLDELDAFKLKSPRTVTIPLWFDAPGPPALATQLSYLRAHHHEGAALPYDTQDTAQLQGLQAAGYFVELFTLGKDPLENAATLVKPATIFTADYPDLILATLGS